MTTSVLIVDDDPITRFIHATLVESLTVKTSCYQAMNGKDALSVLSTMDEHVNNIILLDINMPIMDGFEFIEAFQKLSNKEKTKIVIVSSSQNPSDVNRSKALGIKEFVSKPILKDYLESIIHSL